MERHRKAAELAARSRLAEQNRRNSGRASLDQRRSDELRRGSGSDLNAAIRTMRGAGELHTGSLPGSVTRGQMASHGSGPEPATKGSASSGLELAQSLRGNDSTSTKTSEGARPRQAPPAVTRPQPVTRPAQRPGWPPMSRLRRPSQDGGATPERLPSRPGSDNSLVSRLSGSKASPRGDFSFSGGSGKADPGAAYRLKSQNDALRRNIQQLRERNKSLQARLDAALKEAAARINGSDHDSPTSPVAAAAPTGEVDALHRRLAEYDHVIAAMSGQLDPVTLRGGFMQLQSLRRVEAARLLLEQQGKAQGNLLSTWPNASSLEASAFHAPAQRLPSASSRHSSQGLTAQPSMELEGLPLRARH